MPPVDSTPSGVLRDKAQDARREVAELRMERGIAAARIDVIDATVTRLEAEIAQLDAAADLLA